MINLAAIFIANGIGLALLLTIFFNFPFHHTTNKMEKNSLMMLCMVATISCIADPICFLCDGKAGVAAFIGVYVGNFLLFLSNLVFGTFWLMFVAYHVKGFVNKWQRNLMITFDSLGLILLIVNFFIPLVFGVSENNTYYRGDFFIYYTIIQFIFVFAGITDYFIARIKGGVLKFFPVLQFVIPGVIGIVVQGIMYGISVIWPSMAVALIGVIISLQNENIYRDTLTGLYNRFYLDKLKEKVQKYKHRNLTAFMIDLNDFKSINDSFGHHIGDEALVQTGALIKAAVGNIGSVIRYAGDEFVIVINSQEDTEIQGLIDKLKKKFDDFNLENTTVYKLSFAIGYAKIDIEELTIDELMRRVDSSMYSDKKKYYLEHPEANRRSR